MDLRNDLASVQKRHHPSFRRRPGSRETKALLDSGTGSSPAQALRRNDVDSEKQVFLRRCRLGRITQMLFIGFCLLFSITVEADVEMRVDPLRVSEGETLRLTIEATNQGSGGPDTKPLEQDFEVLGVSSGNKISIVNGRTDARSTWQLTLLPKRSGVLTIPSLDVAGEKTQPLVVSVVKATIPDGQSGADIFLETEVDTTKPYVQGQIIYKVRLFHAVNLTDGQLRVPLPDGMLVERLGDDRRFEQERNGRRYAVIERRFALFPQTSGTLELAEPVFAGEVPDKRIRGSRRSHGFFSRDPFENFFTTTRTVRVRGEAKTLEVRPWPDQLQGTAWLPAGALSLTEEWMPENTGRVTLGEAVTRTLTLQAEGALGTQLPDLSSAPPTGVKAYPDQAETKNQILGDGILGSRVQKIAYVPSQVGRVTLPAVELAWWDTDTDSLQKASLPARIIEVMPAPGQTPSQAASGQAEQDTIPSDRVSVSQPSGMSSASDSTSLSNPWLWLALVLLIAWLGTLILWWRERQRKRMHAVAPTLPQQPNPANAKKSFHDACKANDAAAARSAALQWAAAHWSDDPPKGLDALARRLTDADTRRLLRELDQSLYSESGENWSGEALSAGLQKLPDIPKRSSKHAVLPELYA